MAAKRSASTTNQEDSASTKRTKSSSTIEDTSSKPMPPSKRILVIGLQGVSKLSKSIPVDKSQSSKFRSAIKSQTADAKKHYNLDLEVTQAKPAQFQSALTDIKSRLQSQKDTGAGFEGVLIGNGIRGTAEYTVFFEDIVNACREIDPGMRLGFNTSPFDILEACKRNFYDR